MGALIDGDSEIKVSADLRTLTLSLKFKSKHWMAQFAEEFESYFDVNEPCLLGWDELQQKLYDAGAGLV